MEFSQIPWMISIFIEGSRVIQSLGCAGHTETNHSLKKAYGSIARVVSWA